MIRLIASWRKWVEGRGYSKLPAKLTAVCVCGGGGGGCIKDVYGTVVAGWEVNESVWMCT